MGKVKLTPEQAKRIEFLKKPSKTGEEPDFKLYLQLALNDAWGHIDNQCLRKLNAETFARAWLEGYEVEPQFKQGDIVVCENEIFKVHNRLHSTNLVLVCDKKGWHDKVEFSRLRHATDNEKIFYELGRKIGEFKIGDKYVTKKGGNSFLLNHNHLNTAKKCYEEGVIEYLYPVESRKGFS